jgi:hypothetical protein
MAGKRDKLHAAIRAYAKGNYAIDKLEPARCPHCPRGARARFAVAFAGEDAARVRCTGCKRLSYIDDSKEFWRANLEDEEDGEPSDAQCPCGAEIFRIAIARAYYADSRDTKWLYLGLECTACAQAAVYADWHVR